MASTSSNSTSSSSSKAINLRSSDGKAFAVEESVVQESNLYKMIEEDCSSDDSVVIPIPSVEAPILSLVIEYCKQHAQMRKTSSLGTGSSWTWTSPLYTIFWRQPTIST